jgi:hypothetical protein
VEFGRWAEHDKKIAKSCIVEKGTVLLEDTYEDDTFTAEGFSQQKNTSNHHQCHQYILASPRIASLLSLCN